MVENSAVMVSWRSTKPPPERVRSHTRAFRNPPQPHMCIQDFLEGSQEPCYINVMSWEKIALPLGPDHSIPLYGGMQVPHSPPSHSPVFAVMANPEVLRAKGKHAADPQETQALVLMMLDFVELMNRSRGLHFARHFRILPDRDLAGELKNVWAAVQMKRAHDTATRASLALRSRDQRDRNQQQQHEELQRMMDEAEMEKYLEQRHHQRLMHEQQRNQKRCEQEHDKNQENACTDTKYSLPHEDVDGNSGALDYSTDNRRKAYGCSLVNNVPTAPTPERPKAIELTNPVPTVAPVTSPTSPPSHWMENCSLKYSEQEYLSTSASESDYTSDDGDATDGEAELEGDIETGSSKRHLLARVTVTVDTPTASQSDKDDTESPEGGGDANALKNHSTR